MEPFFLKTFPRQFDYQFLYAILLLESQTEALTFVDLQKTRSNHFALMEGQLLIAALTQRVHFSLVPGQTIVADPFHNLATRPGEEVLAEVKRR